MELTPEEREEFEWIKKWNANCDNADNYTNVRKIWRGKPPLTGPPGKFWDKKLNPRPIGRAGMERTGDILNAEPGEDSTDSL